MAEPNQEVTVTFEELALSNSVTLSAVVELLEEKGVLTKEEVFHKVSSIREKRAAPGSKK